MEPQDSPKRAPREHLDSPKRAQGWSKMGLRYLEIVPGWPKTQDGPKMASGWPKSGPSSCPIAVWGYWTTEYSNLMLG